MSTVQQRQQRHNHPQQQQQLDGVRLDNSARIPVNLDGHAVPRRSSIGQITASNNSGSGATAVRSSGRAGGTAATSLDVDAAVSSGRPPDDQPPNASTTTTTTTAAAAAAGLKHRSAGPAAALFERRLDDSVETVYREWDSGLRSRIETTLAVRPVQPASYVSLTPSLLPVSARERRQRPAVAAAAAAPSCDSSAGSRQPQRRPVNVDVVQANNITKSSKRNEANGSSKHINNGSGLLCGSSSGDDSFDDGGATSRSLPESSSLYSNASTSASEMTSSQRHNFHVEFDADGYEPSDVTVRVSDGRLVVHGVRQEADGGRRSTTEFCRKIRLPDDIDVTQLSCRMVDGRVILEAPRLHVAAPHQTDVVPSSGRVAATADQPPLNVPVVNGDQLTLLVEVGRVFRADDVVVKVRNSTSTLTVSAERVETTPGCGARLNASLAWQFDLPAAIDVDSLRAGLTLDGLLRVTARLIQQQQQQQQQQQRTAESHPVVTVVSD